jgi:hypothetical protein
MLGGGRVHRPEPATFAIGDPFGQRGASRERQAARLAEAVLSDLLAEVVFVGGATVERDQMGKTSIRCGL